jgi:hypothetical protein
MLLRSKPVASEANREGTLWKPAAATYPQVRRHHKNGRANKLLDTPMPTKESRIRYIMEHFSCQTSHGDATALALPTSRKQNPPNPSAEVHFVDKWFGRRSGQRLNIGRRAHKQRSFSQVVLSAPHR